MSQALDILAFAAHPDDAEISAAGTIIRAVSQGYRVGITDLTAGELGSRGSVALRMEEAARSSEMMGIHVRENLGLADGFFEHNEDSLRRIITSIRRHRPRIVLCTAPTDRHPDHGKASKLIADACFYSGLRRIETSDNGLAQEHWRPSSVYQYIQDYYLKPDFVVDVTSFWDKKIETLKCFASQFYDPNSEEPQTPISGEEFFEYLKGRALHMGRYAGIRFGEGFIATRPPMINDLGVLF